MRLRDGLRQNLGLKVLSVALALLLWSFVHGAKTSERELWLPMRYVGLPDSLMLLDAPPRQARVLVVGPAQELVLRLRLVPGADVRIDLSAARPPVHHVAPDAVDVQLPAGARITPVRVLEPAGFDLRVAHKLERLVPVQAMLSGTPLTGHCLADTPRVLPAAVRCTGAAHLVAAIGTVRTRPIDVAARRETFSVRVGLESPGAEVAYTPAEVRVEVPIDRLRRRSLADTPLTIMAPSAGDVAVDVRPARASLTLSGPESRLQALEPHDVAVILDVSGLPPGRYRALPLVPKLPAWARLDSLQPPAVEVSIHRRPR
jgi:hypothetical protein